MDTLNAENCASCKSNRRFVTLLATVAPPFLIAVAMWLIVSGWKGADYARASDAQDAKSNGVLNGPAPELAGIQGWQNSKGTTLAALKGKVVVLHFWTFGCINCQRNLPIYNAWQKDFGGKDVQIIGVHTPETDDEAKVENIIAQVKKRHIEYPVAFDRDGDSWKAYANRYWPAVYLIDRQGKVRFRWEGELESGDAHGDSIMRQRIDALLAEKE